MSTSAFACPDCDCELTPCDVPQMTSISHIEPETTGANGVITEKPHYWAFLSYSHQDNMAVRSDGTHGCVRWAEWLHKELESYRVPGHFSNRQTRTGENMPRRFFPVFQDEKELPINADLGQSIRTALEQSRFLIVICSPRSAASRYVNEEVRYFKQLGRGDRILALMVDGEPNASSGTKQNVSIDMECFCPALRHPLGADGIEDPERFEPQEPIAGDVRVKRRDPPKEASRAALDRAHKDVMKQVKLKLIAGLMGVGLDELVQRDKIARRRRLLSFIGVTVAAVSVLMWLGVDALHQRNIASKQRTAIDEWTQRYSEAYGEKADAERLRAVSDALANTPAPFETVPVEWVLSTPEDEHAARVAEIRGGVTKGLTEVAWSEILWLTDPSSADPRMRQSAPPQLQMRGPSQFAPGSRLLEPRPPRPSSMVPGASPGTSDTGSLSRDTSTTLKLPERFVLTGRLAAVRLVEGKTYVFVAESAGKKEPYQSIYSGNLMPLACVIFESSKVADAMADYAAGDELSVTVSRRSWDDPIVSDPNVRMTALSSLSRQNPSRDSNDTFIEDVGEWRGFAKESVLPLDHQCHYQLYWCFHGEGMEQTGKSGTWITPGVSRAGKIANLPAVVRAPGRMFRSLPQWTGTRGIMRGQYESVYQDGGRVYLKLTMQDAIEGPLDATVDMGPEASLEEFLDYQRGDILEADVTLTAPASSRMLPTSLERMVNASRQPELRMLFPPDPARKPVMLDPLLRWGSFAGSARWVRVRDKPATLILFHGPRRKTLLSSRTANVTPDLARANIAFALGKEVTWTGNLAEMASSNGQTHLKIAVGESALGLDSFEVVTSHSALLEELADYVAKSGPRKGDEVSVTGVVRSPDGMTFRLEKDAPLLELRAMQRTGDARSRIAAGIKRDPATMKPLTPDMALTSPATTVGRQATWTGTLKKITRAQGESHLEIDDDASGSFEAVTHRYDFVAQLSDYVTKEDAYRNADKVSITGRIRSPDGLKFRLQDNLPVLEIEMMQRVGDEASKVVAGQKRDPATLRQETLQSEFVLLKRDRPRVGDKVHMIARFNSFNASDNSVSISPRSAKDYSTMSLVFPNAMAAWFADYKHNDVVDVTGTASALTTDYKFVLDGQSIGRVANPASQITSEGRKVPAINIEPLKKRWDNRKERTTDSKSSRYTLVGLYSGFLPGSPWSIKLTNVFFSYETLDLSGAPSDAAASFLRELAGGDELIVEVEVSGGPSYKQQAWIRTMSRINMPDTKVAFDAPPDHSMSGGTIASNHAPATPSDKTAARAANPAAGEYFTKQRIVFNSDSGVQSIPAATRVSVVSGQQGQLIIDDGRVQIPARAELLTQDPDVIKALLAPQARALPSRPTQPIVRSQESPVVSTIPTVPKPAVPNPYVASQIAEIDVKIAGWQAEIKRLEEAESQSRKKGRISSAGVSISRCKEQIKELQKQRGYLQQKL